MPIAVDSCQERSENKLATGSVTVHRKGSEDIVDWAVTLGVHMLKDLPGRLAGQPQISQSFIKEGKTCSETFLSFSNTLCLLISKLRVHSYVMQVRVSVSFICNGVMGCTSCRLLLCSKCLNDWASQVLGSQEYYVISGYQKVAEKAGERVMVTKQTIWNFAQELVGWKESFRNKKPTNSEPEDKIRWSQAQTYSSSASISINFLQIYIL